MVARNVQLRQVLWVYLLFCWGSVAYATEITFADGINSLTMNVVGHVLVLSILGGMAGTLPKIVNPAVQIRSIPLEILKDTICSLVAGLIFFFVAVELRLSWAWTCLLLLLGGAGGAKVIDLVLNNGLFPRIAQFFGKLPDPGPQMPAPPQPPREDVPQ